MDQSVVSQSKSQSEPVCGKEALDLLNCVTQSPYDQDKCLRLLQSLRDCVLNKVPFPLSLSLSLFCDGFMSFVACLEPSTIQVIDLCKWFFFFFFFFFLRVGICCLFGILFHTMK